MKIFFIFFKILIIFSQSVNIFNKGRYKMFGDKLKQIRKQNKIGQVELAKKLNVANGTISMWENNLRTPDLETIKKIAKVFNIALSDLVDDYKLNRIPVDRKSVV